VPIENVTSRTLGRTLSPNDACEGKGGVRCERSTWYITWNMSRGTRHTSHVTRHTSHVTRHTSHVTRHTSHVTRHMSNVSRHTSHITRLTSHAHPPSHASLTPPLQRNTGVRSPDQTTHGVHHGQQEIDIPASAGTSFLVTFTHLAKNTIDF
jgi:hypothetical protein